MPNYFPLLTTCKSNEFVRNISQLSFLCSHESLRENSCKPNTFPDYDPETAKENMAAIQTQIQDYVNSEESWNLVYKCEQHFSFRNYTNYTVKDGRTGIALLHLLRTPHRQRQLEVLKNYYLRLENVVGLKSKIETTLGLNIRFHPVRKNKKPAFIYGNSAIFAVGAVICDRIDDRPLMRHLIEWLTDMSSWILFSDKNVVIDGIVGYLYSLLYVNFNIPTYRISVPDELIKKVIKHIILVGKQESKEERYRCPLVYNFVCETYWGAAYGLAGVLYMLLQARATKREYVDDDDLKYLIKPSLDFLVKKKLRNGSYRLFHGSPPYEYVQWCNGTTGFIYLFCMAFQVFGDRNYLRLALEAGDVVWEKGLVSKGPCLCHGIAGNAYGFLQLYQTTKDEKHLYRALKFAQACLDYKMTWEVSPSIWESAKLCFDEGSLFEGLPGIMYLLIDILNPKEAKFPGFALQNYKPRRLKCY